MTGMIHASADLEARLADLETRLTFVDDAVDGLSVADADQARRLLALERAMHDLRTEITALRYALNDSSRTEPPPPHY